jgi:hypothetical protein
MSLLIQTDLGILAQFRQGFFFMLTRHWLQRGTFMAIVHLQTNIKRYIAEHSRSQDLFSGPNPPAPSSRP